MATFDNTVNTSANFKGYTGNPPTTEAEYDALDCVRLIHTTASCLLKINGGLDADLGIETNNYQPR